MGDLAMTDYREHSGRFLRQAQGFSLLEVMTVVAVLGILATFAFPSTRRMLDRAEAKASATQVAGLLNDARTRAVTEGTPHLVYFNSPEVGADGECAAMAVEVRDSDHSYSITAGDDTREFKLTEKACDKVKPYGEGSGSEIASVPMPMEDRAVRAPDAAEIGIVPTVTGTVGTVVGGLGETVGGLGGAVGGLLGGGSGSSGSGSSGSGSSGSGSSGSGSSGSGSGGSGSSSTVAEGTTLAPARSATIAETVVNGATFPVDATDGRPVIAFSERGVPVDPSSPTSWGSGAGGVYLTDGESAVFAAVVGPLGDVQLRVFDAAAGGWR
jgi:prepilin-type N-terminal cleavage/methylation domain-containing protein